MNEYLHITIEVSTHQTAEIKELAKLAAEIQKEHSCNCTLIVKRN